jgi:hypothetical protein
LLFFMNNRLVPLDLLLPILIETNKSIPSPLPCLALRIRPLVARRRFRTSAGGGTRMTQS